MAIKANPTGRLWRAVKATERKLIREALSRTDGDVTRAAAWLGIEHSTLYKKIGALGIQGRP